jgi:hypothetical protein
VGIFTFLKLRQTEVDALKKAGGLNSVASLHPRPPEYERPQRTGYW